MHSLILAPFGLAPGGLCLCVAMPRSRVQQHPGRLHLENVAHLYLLSNDFKQRKAFLAADSAQQFQRIVPCIVISCSFTRRSIPQNVFITSSTLTRTRELSSLDKRFTGKVGPSRRATKTLDSMTATTLRSERVNPTPKLRSLDNVNAVPSHMLLLTGVLCKEALAHVC
jgi:hypothetical protein